MPGKRVYREGATTRRDFPFKFLGFLFIIPVLPEEIDSLR
jgi:hypothetical protein